MFTARVPIKFIIQTRTLKVKEDRALLLMTQGEQVSA